MGNNFLNKILFRLRVKAGYNVKRKEKSYYRKQFINVIICILIILMIIVMKNINSKPTDKVIKVVKETLSHDTNIIKSSKKAIDTVKGVIINNDKVVSVFNLKDDDNIDEYIIPVNGSIYKDFGKEVKPNNITVYNRGIEILASEDEVVSIGKGEVIDISDGKLLGKIIRVDYGEVIAKYGNIEDVYISQGQKISKGEKIGKLSNMIGKRKILYLELQQNGIPIDPLSKIDFTSSSLVAR